MAKRRAERRQHKRHRLSCPIKLMDEGGNVLVENRTINISEGGALLTVPVAKLPQFGTDVNTELSVPRSTENTYMLERFVSTAHVLRQQPLKDHEKAGVAIRFRTPIRLALEV